MCSGKEKRGWAGLSEMPLDEDGGDKAVSSELGSEPAPEPCPEDLPTTEGVILWNPKLREPSATAGGKKPDSSVKRSQGSGRIWVYGIAGLGAVVVIAANIAEYNKKSGRSAPTRAYRPYNTPYSTPSSSAVLRQEIESGKLRAKEMEDRLAEMDDGIDDVRRTMRAFRAAGMTEEFNARVKPINTMVAMRNEFYEEYQMVVDQVNEKVRRYNAGYR